MIDIKIGVVIIFRNSEGDFDSRFFIEQLNNTKNTEFCFVNNCSKDKTLLLLRYIKQKASIHISILDIKKYKSKQFATRAGARYLLNFFDLECIRYMDINSFKNEYGILSELIKRVSVNNNYSSSISI